MTITHLGAKRLKGLSSDTRPTNVPSGSILENTNTNKSEIFQNSEWYPVLGSGGWKEIGRSTSATPSVTSLPNMRYYMILTHMLNDGSGNPQPGMRFNNDSGTNYAKRASFDGGADATGASADHVMDMDINGGTINNAGHFNISYVSNLYNKEKLLIANQCYNRTSLGAGTAPDRYEHVGKWTNTTSALNRVDIYNRNTGAFQSGSEVVVLGYDPSDNHTSNFWQELDSVTLGSTTDTFSSNTFTAKKYLWVQAYLKNSGAISAQMRFNSDSGSNYASRHSINGGGDTTGTANTSGRIIHGGLSNQTTPMFVNVFIINVSSKEKLVIGHGIAQNTAGAANVPEREEAVFKWTNTSDSITSLSFFNGEAGDYVSGSILKVWGHD